jgi:uncharacterized protein (TIGR02453 family)
MKISLTNRQFKGFTPEALQFLRDVKSNNSKEWYDQHKPDYRNYLLHPFQDLVADLSASLIAIDPLIVTIPAVDKTLSRIYRDTRFSQDKTRYRDAMWLAFKRSIKEWAQTPVFYFEITPDWYRYGMGFYSALPATMARFRQKIDANPRAFLRAVSFYGPSKPFMLEGDKYKRLIKSDHPAVILDWYQRKNFYLTCQKSADDRLFSPMLADDLLEGFAMMAPLYQYLWQI